MVVEWILLSVSTLTVLARIIARVCVEDDRVLRRIKVQRLHIEDALMALSLVRRLDGCDPFPHADNKHQLGQYCHAITATVAVSRGLGHHIWMLDNDTIMRCVHLIQTIKGLSIVPSCLARVSIALYQLRILPPSSSYWKLAPLMVVVIFDPIVNLITIIQIYAQCGAHVSALWNPAVATIAHCENPVIETNIGYGQSGTVTQCISMAATKLTKIVQLPIHCVISSCPSSPLSSSGTCRCQQSARSSSMPYCRPVICTNFLLATQKRQRRTETDHFPAL